MDVQLVHQYLEHLDYAPAPESDAKVQTWLESRQRQFGHFINGTFVGPMQKQHFPTIAPTNGLELAQIAFGTAEDVDQAVQAAQAAWPAWRDLSGHARARYLYAIARVIAKYSRFFEVLEALDNGKTFRETKNVDVPLVIRHFYYFAGWADVFADEFPHRRSGGVVAQIIPWNFPLLMFAWKVAAAIAVGNTVVIKPAEFTSLSVLFLAELLRDEVKLPPGVINIVTGNEVAGAALAAHPSPWKVAFTGSTPVGRDLRRVTAGSGKHLTLELGGKSPFIICEDADLEAAVYGLVQAIWFNYGQVCCAGSRALIQESVFERMVMLIKRQMDKLRGGLSLDKTMDVGKVVAEVQWERIMTMLEGGRREGAHIYQPEGWICAPGSLSIPPTLCTRVEPADSLAQKEIFGPVLVAIPYRTVADALRLADNNRFGLAATIFTQDVGKAFALANGLRSGIVWVNCTQVLDPAAGFGGTKESGFGREGGRDNIREVTVEDFPAPHAPDDHLPVEQADGEMSMADHQSTLASTNGPPPIDQTYRLLIGGALSRGDGGASWAVSKNGMSLALVADANYKDIRDAVAKARAVHGAWQARTAHNRAQILYFWAEKLELHRAQFTDDIVAQTGRSLASASEEFDAAIRALWLAAARADKFEGRVESIAVPNILAAAVRKPVGVIGIRAEDRFPLLGIVAAVAPALVMGNTVVVQSGKHALTAARLMEVIQNADIPGSVLNVLTGSKPDELADVLAEHEDVDAVWSFSSREAGARVEAKSASNMKRTFVTLGREIDWFGSEGRSLELFYQATETTTILVAYGV